MGNTFYFGWEVALIQWMQGSVPALLGKVLIFFTILGSETVIVGLLGALYWSLNKHWGKRVGVGMVIALLVGPLLKNIALRRRPYMDHESIRCLQAPGKGELYSVKDMGFSMPSMHASDSFALFGGLAAIVKKRWYTLAAAFCILAVGISRCYVGVHYPTDVMLGWLIGGVVLAAVPWVEAHRKSYLQLAVILGILTLPGWFYCTSNDFFTAYGVLWGILLSFHFEESHPFDNTKVAWKAVLRIVLGVAVFLAVCEGLKQPFPKELLESQTVAAYLIRTGRYFIGSFVSIGLYPLSFKKLKI